MTNPDIDSSSFTGYVAYQPKNLLKVMTNHPDRCGDGGGSMGDRTLQCLDGVL